MAKCFVPLLPILLTILLLAFAVTESKAYSTTTPFEGHKPDKLTHLHFYFHDVITGDKPTAIRVAAPPGTNSSTVSFGVVMIADDPLTEGPDPSSKEVGRAQGMYTSTDMKILSFTMVFNLVFTEGEFNGSTVAMYGRNPIMSKVREMPIIGGTGAFRFARGYAQARTYKLVGLNAVVEYNVFIWH
ncbi:Dirigent protein 2 [Raphanus sativus]|uniref:Dirigent protein n=1 Tax=Raphanus sativus TaxID=3726 RepID=A0A9W3DQT8_RAPSA|nr:dirigent protein 2-like [Raphanus sativus]KAJ4916442.1 Dirigent protein 2 [Raphanus sativus]